MTLTNGEIVNLYENLRAAGTKSLPIAVGFVLIKDLKIIEPIYNAIMEMRSKIISEVGEPLDDGTIRIPPEFVETTNQKLKSLSEIENTIDLTQVSLTTLGETLWTLDEINGIYPIINGEA